MERTRPKIIIADDHTLVAEACKKLLEAEYDVVATVGDGRALVQVASTLKPQLIVIDVAIPLLNGLDAGQQIKQMLPSVKLVYLTMSQNADMAAEAFRRGASAYLLKTCAASELTVAVREVLKGRSYLSPVIASDTVDFLLRQGKVLVEEGDRLTERQREVLQLLAEGKSMKEIASVLNLAPHSVMKYVSRISDKLGIWSREPTVVQSSGALKEPRKAGFAVKKPGSEDYVWFGPNWEPAAAEPVFKPGLHGGSTHVALAIAVRVARDRWTDADDKRYSTAFKKMIFDWADEIGKIPKALTGLKRALANRKRKRKVC